MDILIRGHQLVPEQLQAILPVIEYRNRKNIPHRQFEELCVEAMRGAGCPLTQKEASYG